MNCRYEMTLMTGIVGEERDSYRSRSMRGRRNPVLVA
jgi:hypothetical protein